MVITQAPRSLPLSTLGIELLGKDERECAPDWQAWPDRWLHRAGDWLRFAQTMFAMRYDSAMEWDRHGLRRWVAAGLIWLGIALLDALGAVTSLREQGRHYQWTTL